MVERRNCFLQRGGNFDLYGKEYIMSWLELASRFKRPGIVSGCVD